MRLTLINQFYAPDLSPTAHLCASLAEHRAKLGDVVTVIAGRGGYVTAATRYSGGAVRVIRLWTAQLGSTSILRRLLDWLTFYVAAIFRTATLPRQDVIIVLTTPPYIALVGLLQKLLHPRTKLVLWNMDCYPEAIERTGMIRPGGLVSRVMRATNRSIFRRIDYLVCLDGAMKDLLLSQYAPRKRSLGCSIIPNWDRADLFKPVIGASPVLFWNARAGCPCHELAWDNPVATMLRGRFVVLYLGNAGYGHEFKTMIEAAEQLKDDPVTFLFVGGGALRPWIAAQAELKGLKNIQLCDYVPKEMTGAVMTIADCALITLEDFAAGVMSPSKLHANLAMGLPVIYIGPKKSNVDEAIERFGCGTSLRVGQAGQVVQFIRAMMRDPKRYSDLRERSRRAFDEAYCDSRAFPQFDGVIDSLLAESRRAIRFTVPT